MRAVMVVVEVLPVHDRHSATFSHGLQSIKELSCDAWRSYGLARHWRVSEAASPAPAKPTLPKQADPTHHASSQGAYVGPRSTRVARGHRHRWVGERTKGSIRRKSADVPCIDA